MTKISGDERNRNAESPNRLVPLKACCNRGLIVIFHRVHSIERWETAAIAVQNPANLMNDDCKAIPYRLILKRTADSELAA